VNRRTGHIANLRLLAACAQPSVAPLAEEARARLHQFFQECSDVGTLVETHGVAPLLYSHARQSSLALSPSVKTTLQALYLRHRRASEIRSQVLAEILRAFRAGGIDVLILKGAALAHTIYAAPGLRPMRDMDLLVRETDATRAQQLLAASGFQATTPNEVSDRHKHLPVATRRIQDMTVSVEVHHDLNEPYMGRRKVNFDELYPNRSAFDVGGEEAYTLGPDDTLVHLCQHGTYLLEPLKLIWCADIVGVANTYVERIDWAQLKRNLPWVLATVAMFGCLVPLSTRVKERLGTTPTSTLHHIGDDFDGWPRVSWKRLRSRGWRRAVGDTFFPGEWWLRLYYGVSLARSIHWTRWVHHPLLILTWPARVLPVMREWAIPAWYRKIFWR